MDISIKPVPQVGDQCMADPIDEGDYEYGVITKIEDGNRLTNIGYAGFQMTSLAS